LIPFLDYLLFFLLIFSPFVLISYWSGFLSFLLNIIFITFPSILF
jgi:hypothetical protein